MLTHFRFPLRTLLCLAFALGWLQAQPPITFRQFGSASDDYAYGVSATASGVYVVGVTYGTLPGQTSAGGNDAFVRKYDANGNELWTRQFGSFSPDWGLAVSATEGGIYVVGNTGGKQRWGDAFVRKYDANGNELWTRQFRSSNYDYAYGVSATAGGVYVVGYTAGRLPGQTSAGGNDAFVRKYDANGNQLWTRQFGSADSDGAYGVSATEDGVYVVGYTAGTQNSGDAFVRKYDANGNELWTRQFGSSAGEAGWAVTATAGGVYVVGETGGTLPGQTSAGGYDAFVRKYDDNGNELWTRQFGSSDQDSGLAVTATADGVYVVGYTRGTLPGQTSAGYDDVSVRKYDHNGNELWTRQFGSSNSDYGHAATATAGGVYVAGFTYGALPGQTSAGGYDAFLAYMSAQ